MKRRFNIFLICGIIGFPAIALPNIPSPVAFGFLFPGWIFYLSTGVLFMGIWLIETLIVKIIIRQNWLKVISLVFFANLISSAVGFLLGMGYGSGLFFIPAIFITLFILKAFLNYYKKSKFPILETFSENQVVYLGAKISFKNWHIYLGLFILGFLFSFLGANFPNVKLSVMLSLVPAFVLTVILEGLYLIPKLKGRLNFLRLAMVNGASYFLLLIVLIITGFHPYQAPGVSTDLFYWNIIPARIKRGDVDGALKSLEEARKLFITPEYSFWHPQNNRPLPWDEGEVYPWSEIKIARLLAQKGYYQEALNVLEWLKGRPKLADKKSYENEINKLYTEVKEKKAESK